uniref:Heat shock protein 70 n=1 Tax=Panagrolaimus sp. PS1159 TaxID=55785 RepID=A0AC35FZ74_9BILA
MYKITLTPPKGSPNRYTPPNQYTPQYRQQQEQQSPKTLWPQQKFVDGHARGIQLIQNGTNYVIPKKEILLKKDFPVIGIDLGTSRCCAAVNRNDGIATVPLDNTGERLLPSFVSYDEEKVKCGRVVMGRLRHYSKSTIFDSKRIIGRPFSDIEIDENWNFNVNFEDKEVYMEIRGVNNERKRITAEAVASDLLRYIKVKAEEYQGKKIANVVITVPAAFTEEQKASTLSAAKLAGWTNIHLLPEPMAAAFAYFLNRPIPVNSTVLLFDLGGGTLDVCIFKVEKDKISIISNTGDTKLGGRNFDTVLINYFKNLLNSEHGITTLKDKKYKLMLECQRIKEDLTTLTNTSLDIDEFDPGKNGEIPISREGFQRMTQPLLNKAKITIQAALFNSNLKENQINQILHVGGGSRMPMIKQLLLDIFPDAEHRSEEHPDEVVAIGAAFYAYSIFSN